MDRVNCVNPSVVDNGLIRKSVIATFDWSKLEQEQGSRVRPDIRIDVI